MDTTLYAKWSTNTFKVSFNSQGGNTLDDITADSYSTVSSPANPTRTGYTFTGWYKEASCTNLWNFATDVVTTDIILYAKWDKINSVQNFTDDALCVFPNPASDMLYIKGEGSENLSISIFDLTGTIVWNGMVNGQSVNLSQLPAGCYILKIFNHTESKIIRFVKQ
jgi:uncharacterized repeat protein (TIGR02543 family)